MWRVSWRALGEGLEMMAFAFAATLSLWGHRFPAWAWWLAVVLLILDCFF